MFGHRAKDLTGQRFGKLVVDRFSCRKKGHLVWLCRCDCGGEALVASPNLIRANTRSCGCLSSETTARRNQVHGLSRTPVHSVWSSMLNRCNNPNAKEYRDYGGRGIKVCDRWRYGEGGEHPLVLFARDMGPRPVGYSIERLNVNGNYEPANCIWADRKTQQINRRSTRYMMFDGVEMPVPKVLEITGISEDVFDQRIRRGWPAEQAAVIPVQKGVVQLRPTERVSDSGVYKPNA